MTRTADRQRLLAADALELPVLQHAQQLGLRRLVQVAHLVEEDGAARRPARTCRAGLRSAPVNAPFSWPNSSLSSRSTGMAAQLTLTNGPDANGLCRCMCAASSSLPVPDSPGQQHARVRARHLRRLLEHPHERRARPDHARGVAHQLAKPGVFLLQGGALQGVGERQQHAVASERLLQEVECPRPRRSDGVGNRPVARNHDHRRQRVLLAHLLEQIEAVPVRQPDVQQVAVRPPPQRMRLEVGRRPADLRAVAGALEHQAQRGADVHLVIDDQDGFRAHGSVLLRRGQQQPERRAAQPAFGHLQIAAGQQGVPSRDRQAQPHAVLLERNRRLEEPAPRLGAQARP